MVAKIHSWMATSSTLWNLCAINTTRLVIILAIGTRKTPYYLFGKFCHILHIPYSGLVATYDTRRKTVWAFLYPPHGVSRKLISSKIPGSISLVNPLRPFLKVPLSLVFKLGNMEEKWVGPIRNKRWRGRVLSFVISLWRLHHFTNGIPPTGEAKEGQSRHPEKGKFGSKGIISRREGGEGKPS